MVRCGEVWCGAVLPCTWEQERPGQHWGQCGVPQREYWVPHWPDPPLTPLRDRQEAEENNQINITANFMLD